jgi:hypothetical protein
MYGQGENFVNGIVAGLESQAGELEISAQSIAEAFTTTFEEVLISGINAAIDAAEAAMARMPRIEDFVGDLNFGTRDGDGDGGRTGGVNLKIDNLPPLLPSADPNRRLTQSEIRGAGRMTTLEAGLSGLFSSPSPAPQQPLNISGTPVSRGNVTYNVYTQSSTRETANALSQLNSKTGSSRTTTSVRALSDFSVG